MRAGRGGGRVGRAMGLEDINQDFALEKEAEEKETTLSITRISSRSCCAAWLQQYFCLPLLWCHWMQDCKVKIQMSKKQHHVALPLPNTREYPGWSASQMYSSAFVFQRLTQFTNHWDLTTFTSESSSQSAVWVQVFHTVQKVCYHWLVLLGLTVKLHPVILRVETLNKDKELCLAVHRILHAFVIPVPTGHFVLYVLQAFKYFTLLPNTPPSAVYGEMSL